MDRDAQLRATINRLIKQRSSTVAQVEKACDWPRNRLADFLKSKHDELTATEVMALEIVLSTQHLVTLPRESTPLPVGALPCYFFKAESDRSLERIVISYDAGGMGDAYTRRIVVNLFEAAEMIEKLSSALYGVLLKRHFIEKDACSAKQLQRSRKGRKR